MSNRASTIKQYMDALPDDRRKALEAIRKVVKANLDPKVKEGIQYGMPAWFIPHSVYPDGYHCTPAEPLPYASIASQKNHMALYLFCMYCEPEEVARFQREWKKTGKRLDMGKSCVRFKKLEDVPLDLIGDTIKRLTAKKFIEFYESNVKKGRPQKKAARKTAKRTTKKVSKVAAKKTAKKKAVKAAPRKKA